MTIGDLFTAIETADLHRVRAILVQWPSLVNNSDPDDYGPDKPLHVAVAGAGTSGESSAIIHELIAAGADVNAFGENGATPLHIAVRQGLIHESIQLVEAGARLDIRDWQDQTPFETIARSRDYSCIGFLLSRGACTSIREAVAFNRIDWANWILRDNPNAVRQESRSSDLTCYAIMNGNGKLLQLLISSGVTIDSNPGGVNPLKMAIGSIEMVQMLLEAKADPNGCRPPVPLPDWRYPAWESPMALARQRGLVHVEALLRHYGAAED